MNRDHGRPPRVQTTRKRLLRTSAAAGGLAAILAFVAVPPAARSGDEPTSTKAPASTGAVLATVNGAALKRSDLDRLFDVQQIPAEARPAKRAEMLEKLIDRTLVRQFLEQQKVRAPQALVDAQLERLSTAAKESSDGKAATLERFGYPNDVLRDELQLRLSWRMYVEQYGEGAGLKEYFAAHRAQFDGTEVHARQILLKMDRNEEGAAKAMHQRLAELRAEIVSGETTFAAAAERHSAAPSRDSGGDVGWFAFRGKMPQPVADAAFSLAAGEVSRPFESPFGVHLVQVIEIRPGDLSLEDVREEVLSAYSDELWGTTAARLRKKARIERADQRKPKGARRTESGET